MEGNRGKGGVGGKEKKIEGEMIAREYEKFGKN